MTWEDHLDWTEVKVGVEMGVVAMFRVMSKGEPVVRELWGLKSIGLVDKEPSLIAQV